jgi:hypothetical protein
MTERNMWLQKPFEEMSPRERNMVRGLRATTAGKLLIDALCAMERQAYSLAVNHSETTDTEFAAFQATGKALAMMRDLLEGEDEPEEDEDA